MEGLKAFYALVSILFVVIGAVMILRKAFGSGVWWGVGCIVLPVVVPVFIVLKWPDTKKGFVILTIGALLFSGNYIVSRRQVNQAISQIQITRITVTTSLNDANLPVNDLKEVSLGDTRVILHVRMRVPPKTLYRFGGRFYDTDGKLLMDSTVPMIPTEPAWNVWFYHNFDKTRDTPGRWRFVFLINEKQLAEQQFDVITSQ